MLNHMTRQMMCTYFRVKETTKHDGATLVKTKITEYKETSAYVFNPFMTEAVIR